MNKLPLKTLSSQQTIECTVCFKKALAFDIWTCEICIDKYMRDPKPRILRYHKQRFSSKKQTAGDTAVCLICSNDSGFGATSWISTCIPCQANVIKLFVSQDFRYKSRVSLLQTQLCYAKAKISFLQQVDPSPFSEDFRGDISFLMKENDKPVRAHRFMLASKSVVFKKMMEIDMSEKFLGEIHIEDMSRAVVQAAVNFMYTGEIAFNDEVCAQEVLQFAHKYEIHWLKDLCEEELVAKLTPQNMPEMLSISYRFGTEMLKNTAKECFTNHPNIHSTVIDEIFNS